MGGGCGGNPGGRDCAGNCAVPPHGGQRRISLPVGHPARPDALIAPAGPAALDRVPLPVRGRPPTPEGARLRHPARGHAKTATRFIACVHTGTGIQKRADAEPLDIGYEANRGLTGCPISPNVA